MATTNTIVIDSIKNKWFFWDVLFRLIIDKTELKSITVNDEVCYQDQCTLEDSCRWKTKPRPKNATVSFQIDYAKINDQKFTFNYYEDNNENGVTVEDFNEMKAFLSNLTPQTQFIYSKNIEIESIRGPSDDHRGSDHLKYRIHMKQKVSIPKVFTLDTIAQAAYAMKSHHFDNWYEMYNDVDVEENPQNVMISVSFDHGS